MSRTLEPVILSGGEASARDRTYAEGVDAAEGSGQGARNYCDPVSRNTGAGHRTVARSAFRSPHDDIARSLANAFSAVALLLLLASLAFAQSLTGTVKNSTTGKPDAGDDVVLLSLGQGMEEAGRTKSDARGNFTVKLDNAQSPHLVRVIHQGVTYHRMAPPGTTSVDIEVFDVSKKVEGIEIIADVMRLQAEQGQLEIMRQFAVQNSSKPPRTQMNERNLEFYVPEGAQIVGGSAMTEGGNPLNTAPVPVDDKKTRYAFVFPLRPGTTQFEVAYQLPYTGSANIDPRSIYPLQHFVAMLPKSIQFSPAPGTNYQVTPYPKEPDANVEVASGTRLGQTLAFKISGEGALRDESSGGEEGGSAQADNRPGGGLGPPIDAPDPLQRYRWWILGGFGAALIVGGVYVASRQQAAARAAVASRTSKAGALAIESDFEAVEVVEVGESKGSQLRASSRRGGKDLTEQVPQASRPQNPTSMLLEGLKEELFQLEIEHKQGRISQQEYEKSKAALDHTLERALKRERQNGAGQST
jgi:hypothetical protein